MSLRVDIPGRGRLELDHVLLDVNGTLSDRGDLIEGVSERVARVERALQVHLLSADTFGTVADVAAALGTGVTPIATGEDKRRIVEQLGAERCAAVGNGANDAAMLDAAALGIAVVGPEGAAGPTIRAADVVCSSILEALDLLLDERALVATLRT